MNFNFIAFYEDAEITSEKTLWVEAETHLDAMLNQFYLYDNYVFIVAIVKTGNGFLMMCYMGETFKDAVFRIVQNELKLDDFYIARENGESKIKRGKIGYSEDQIKKLEKYLNLYNYK